MIATDMDLLERIPADQPERLAALQARWWEEAAANKLRRWQEIPGFLVVTCRQVSPHRIGGA